MRKSIFLLLLIFIFSACEKGYKDEIFIEKYRSIYGRWQFQFGVGETGFIFDNYTIEFIKYGLFRYKDGKEGKIKVVRQDEIELIIDFDLLIPKVKYSNIWLSSTGDTLSISPYFGPTYYYTRIR